MPLCTAVPTCTLQAGALLCCCCELVPLPCSVFCFCCCFVPLKNEAAKRFVWKQDFQQVAGKGVPLFCRTVLVVA